MYVVSVQAHYDSAHYLRNYRGKCERLHGHRYVVEAAFATTELNEAGIAFDFVEIKRHLRALADELYRRVDWTWLGMTIPQLSLVAFSALAVFAILLAFLKK